MAFSKYANAVVAQPVVTIDAWDEVRSKALVLGPAFDQRQAASKLTLQKYDPKEVMLSHCTIIASVDTEPGPGVLGRHMEGGQEIHRRFQDYYITTDTSKYVNNNSDAWERKLLLGTFRTFIGGQNYVEHLQVPELSKGRIIDAVARDIGDSVYVDILVATEKKHRPLVAAIQSGQLNTLSMGCTCLYSTCTRCGNVAEDETQLCAHVKYSRGNHFIDALGKTRKIAELVGHHTDPVSVKFIEASWVANPAFKGAVLRNILTPEETALLGPKVQQVWSLPTPTIDPNHIMKAAYQGPDRVVRVINNPARVRTNVAQQMDFGPGGEFEGADPGQAEEAEDPIQKTVDSLADLLKEKALEKVKGEMTKNEVDPTPRADHEENRNNNLIKEAAKSPHWRRIAQEVLSKVKDQELASRIVLGLLHFKNGGWQAVKQANSFSGREVLAISRFLDQFQGSGIAGEARIYRTVLAVGGVAPYGDVESFFAACRRIFGRELTTSERDALITKGRLFDLGMS